MLYSGSPACRAQASASKPEQLPVSELFGLPKRIDDGSREAFERVFQALDRNEDRYVSLDELWEWAQRELEELLDAAQREPARPENVVAMPDSPQRPGWRRDEQLQTLQDALQGPFSEIIAPGGM